MTVSILVVDDETDVVDLFKRRFRRELKSGDYAMHFALSGEEALETLVHGVEPEVMVVLSDINMPGINGLELLEEAKQRWPLLPLVIVTAYGDSENRRKAYEAGALDFVTKPIDFDALKAKITNILTLTGG
jgi:CheY-like chemotaxis protein